MSNSLRIMKTGAGRYIQGEEVVPVIGLELKRLGYKKVGIISGNTAFHTVGNALLDSLDANRVHYKVFYYAGLCTYKDLKSSIEWLKSNLFDCLLGIGGGKVLDFCKASGARVGCPVFMLPTVASTCAAFTPLSVMYDDDGHQQSILFHEDSVAGVFVDLKVIVDAPWRFLAAGIADAFAKYCEYTSMLSSISFEEMEFGRFIGAGLARMSDEVLYKCAREAVAANKVNAVTEELQDVVACVIGTTGVASGFGSFSKKQVSRFAIAHGLNELVRGTYIPDSKRFLHGEIVGVGILAQMRVNKQSKESIRKLESLFSDLSLPTKLSQIGIGGTDFEFHKFLDDILLHCHIELNDQQRIKEAFYAIR